MHNTPLTRRERIIGGIVGLLVGDACGVPVEFSLRHERDSAPVYGMRGWGTHHQPPGTWSDDGAMVLAHVETFLRHGWDPQAHLQSFCQWYHHGVHSAHGHAFDIGNTTRLALRRFRNQRPLDQVGGRSERDNGNGSLMRMLPIACWFAQAEPRDLISMAGQASALTHAHTRSQTACAYYCLLVSELLRGNDFAHGMHWANEQLRPHLAVNEAPHFARIINGDIRHAERSQINSSGYVIDSLEAALWCCHHYGSNYRQAVLSAINLGGDTDTTAAIVGSLVGIHLGQCAIDRNWVSLLAQSSHIMAQAETFADRCGSKHRS